MDGCGSSDDLDMHSDVQILDIDGVEDLQDKSLNKSKRTADLEEFFYKMADLLDQKKVHVDTTRLSLGHEITLTHPLSHSWT